jgi:hypothetical protein
MKMSVNIDQHIGAESFPSFPASRRFRGMCIASMQRLEDGTVKMVNSPRRCPSTSVNVRQCSAQPLHRFTIS